METHRIIDIGSLDKLFVYRGRCYTALELWFAGLAKYGGGGWS